MIEEIFNWLDLKTAKVRVGGLPIEATIEGRCLLSNDKYMGIGCFVLDVETVETGARLRKETKVLCLPPRHVKKISLSTKKEVVSGKEVISEVEIWYFFKDSGEELKVTLALIEE
jgi:hypothetical protein